MPQNRYFLTVLLFIVAFELYAQESACDWSNALSDQIRAQTIRLDCDLSICQGESEEALIRLSGLKVNQAIDRLDLNLACQRLIKSEYFSRIAPEYQSGTLVLHVIPQEVIRSVHFKGASPLFESELKKRLFLRPGSPMLDPKDLLDTQQSLKEIERETLQRQTKSLAALYRKEGYQDTAVIIQKKKLQKPFVHLEIQIKAGHRLRLNRVFIRGHHRFTYDELYTEFTSHFGFSGYFNVRAFEEASQSIAKLYREEGYLQMHANHQMHIDDSGNEYKVDVSIDIDEGPQWIIQFEFLDHQSFDPEELEEVLTFKEAGYVDESEIENSIIELKSIYQTSGFYWVQIQALPPKMDDREREVLTFQIKEGERAQVYGVQFCKLDYGLEDLDPEMLQKLSEEPPCIPIRGLSSTQLLEALNDRGLSGFNEGDYLQQAQLAENVEAIVDIYQQKGFLQPNVPRWELLGKDQGRALWIRLWIVEGQQTHIRKVHVLGGIEKIHRALLKHMETKEGEIYDPQALLRDLGRFHRPYRKEGYALPKIDRICREAGEERKNSYGIQALKGALAIAQGGKSCLPPKLPAGCLPTDPQALCQRIWDEDQEIWKEDCRRAYHCVTHDGSPDDQCQSPQAQQCVFQGGLLADWTDIDIFIDPGHRFYVGDFFIHGNFVTQDWVILQRFSLHKGDPLDPGKLLQSQGKLRQLNGIFQSSHVQAIGLDEKTDRPLDAIPIVITVEEGERRWVDFSAGLSVVSENFILAGDIEFVEANLLGWGWEFRLYQLGEIDLADTTWMGTWPWINHCECNEFLLASLKIPSLPILQMDLFLQTFYDQQRIPDLEQEVYGQIFELRQQWKQWLFYSIAFEIKRSANRQKADALFTPDGDPLFEPRITTTSIIPSVRFERRDNPMNPSKGWYLDTKVKLAASVLANSESFIKVESEGGFFWPISRIFKLAFGLHLGKAFLFGQERLQADERFLTDRLQTMRGFGAHGIGPSVNGVSIGGELLLNGNVEMRFPILKDSGLDGALFWDTGALVNTFDELNTHAFRMSAGLGIRYQLAGLFPIVLDYAMILDRRFGEPFGDFQLNVGFPF